MTDSIMKRQKQQFVEIGDDIFTATESEAVRLEFAPDKKWAMMFMWLIVIVIMIFVGRLFYMSVMNADDYRAAAEDNSVRTIPVIAPRGNIYDRKGVALARNVPSFSAVVIPRELPKEEDERMRVIEEAGVLLNANTQEFYELFEALPTATAVLLKENITQDQSLLLATRATELPGIAVQKTGRRQYDDGLIFSHIMGYEGKVRPGELEAHPEYLLIDRIGKDGVEYSHESALRGDHGSESYIVDSRGRIAREIDRSTPVPGDDLYLNIDAGLQKKLFDTLNGALEKAETQTAAAVALDPRTGAVRAIVSLPSYDNNLFAQGIAGDDYQRLITNEERPLFNRVISGVYPPGSTIKPVLAAAALQERIIDPARQIESRGGISLGSFFFGDWKVHGFTDMRRAIAVSSDVYFYSIGGGYGAIKGMGMDLMKKYEELFGYGEKTGIDLPGEVKGLIPDEQWKQDVLDERWYIGNTYHASIGQGYITATPLQIANTIAAIANDGTLYKPQMVSHIKKANGETIPVAPEILRKDFIDPEHMTVVQEGMRQTITEGTAQYMQTVPVEVAGKTGTAQFGGQDDKVHSWFTAYAPYEDPELVLVVLMEGQTAEESTTTVPVAKEVFDWYFADRAPKEEMIIETTEGEEDLAEE